MNNYIFIIQNRDENTWEPASSLTSACEAIVDWLVGPSQDQSQRLRARRMLASQGARQTGEERLLLKARQEEQRLAREARAAKRNNN